MSQRKKTPRSSSTARCHHFARATLHTTGTTKPRNNKILQYYYNSCERHKVLPNANAAVAFAISSPYLLASKVENTTTELSHILPICETLAAFNTEASIRHLSFQSCRLGPMCVPALAACLKVNFTVTQLDLPGNLITDAVADAVGDIIVTALSLECLNIDANGMTQKAARVIAKAVVENGGNSTQLHTIDLTNNYLTQDGVDVLLRASQATGIDIALETGNFCVEETWNAITHGCGSAWSITMLFLLCRQAASCNASERTWSAIITYSISQLIMFLCSTLYHSFSCCVAPSVIYVFGVLDHTAIYLLIAGTYTPFLMASPLYEQYNTIAWASMIAVWLLAFCGICLDVMCDATNATAKRIGLLIYLIQGWFVLLISPWLFPLISGYSLRMLGLGGLAYTGGVYFYILGESKVKYHVLWHLFVFLGAVLHYFSVQDLLFGEKGVHSVCT